MARPVGAYAPASGDELGSEASELAKFAIDEYNSQNSMAAIRFSRVVSESKQVVEGIVHLLVIEAVGKDGQIKQFEAKIWVKPWKNFKQLVEFKPI